MRIRTILHLCFALPAVACGSHDSGSAVAPPSTASGLARASVSPATRAPRLSAQSLRQHSLGHAKRQKRPLPGERPLPAVASSSVRWVSCSADAQAQGAACGTLAVPLDRAKPHGSTVNVYFEVYSHTQPGPAESALLANMGGPGFATTPLRDLWLATFGVNLDVHDLLLIDDRGQGGSTVIDCEALQHGTGTSLDQEVADCATHLGPADGSYAAADIALDTEAVRAALGYDKVDYYGGLAGGTEATAYATRFGKHVRSLVLDSPQGPPSLAVFQTERYEATSTLREVRLECLRSPSCAADHPYPDADFEALVATVRGNPVTGTGFDPNGNSVDVRLDESLLASIAMFGGNLPAGELLAAGSALRRGDTAPLIRLGAEAGGGNLLVDSGPATSFSWGAFYATECSDLGVPYTWADPTAERFVQLDRAVAALPASYFAPFSSAAVISEVGGSNTRLCVDWEEPTPPLPVVPPRAVFPSAPTLVLATDIDPGLPIELATRDAALFPDGTYITIAEASHTPVLSDPCANAIATTFLETLSPGDTTCARTPSVVWPAVGTFPLWAKDAHAAEVDPSGHNAIAQAERRVASVAVATAVDALKRASFYQSAGGVGLRGGTFQVSTGSSVAVTIALIDCAFATDVTVGGTVTWGGGGADASFVADLQVAGSGTAGGTLHVQGAWQAQGPVGQFAVSGALGGKTVAVLVPEA